MGPLKIDAVLFKICFLKFIFILNHLLFLFLHVYLCITGGYCIKVVWFCLTFLCFSVEGTVSLLIPLMSASGAWFEGGKPQCGLIILLLPLLPNRKASVSLTSYQCAGQSHPTLHCTIIIIISPLPPLISTLHPLVRWILLCRWLPIQRGAHHFPHCIGRCRQFNLALLLVLKPPPLLPMHPPLTPPFPLLDSSPYQACLWLQVMWLNCFVSWLAQTNNSDSNSES